MNKICINALYVSSLSIVLLIEKMFYFYLW